MSGLHEFGDLEERKGFRGFRCRLCDRFVIGERVSRQGCDSPDAQPLEIGTAESDEYPTPPPCRHMGEQLGEVPCGCGRRGVKMPVHRCELHGVCMARSNGKAGTRWEGSKPAICLGCEQYETA
jgi:hypothetical protein